MIYKLCSAKDKNVKMVCDSLPDDALCARTNGFEVLVPFQDGETCVSHFDRVEM